MEGQDALLFQVHVLDNMHIIWTFLLLATRYTLMMSVVPGLGGGKTGLRVRVGGILALTWGSMITTQYAVIPENGVLLLGQAFSEVLLGSLLAMIPMMIIAGVQMGGMLSSVTMGLGAAQLVDPTMGGNVTSVARLLGDITILLFLLLGGHHVVVYAVSGLGGQIVPGTFIVTAGSVELFTDITAKVFEVGILVSAPVLVALLATQFVMGVISKAVPTVNIFIVSFPLTIGIGLILTALGLPELLVFVERQLLGLEGTVVDFLKSAQVI